MGVGKRDLYWPSLGVVSKGKWTATKVAYLVKLEGFLSIVLDYENEN